MVEQQQQEVQAESRVEITDVTDVKISDEFAGLFETFPDIDEVEFEALSPFVMQFYL